MTYDELKEKARSLPMSPGVYLMQNKAGQVIYVGKAKKLKNRVSNYFQDSVAHSLKTKVLVSQIFQFDVIVAASEFEALVLECSLIKRHQPKYNILLKDDKGYPYVRIDMNDMYPSLTMVNHVADDGAMYFGPFGGRYITQNLMDAIRLSFRLPGCSRVFPRDIGKDRPCLNHHMNNCDAWCQRADGAEEYRTVMKQVILVLQGKFHQVEQKIREEMQAAADDLAFERAAFLRDRLFAIENLGKKQLVTAGTMAHTDVIGYYQSTAKACFTVLHYIDGNLLDKDYEILPVSDSFEEAVSTLVKQYYLAKNAAPREILLPCDMEDAQLFSDFLFQKLGKRVRIRRPARGDNVKLVHLACRNAEEEAERVTSKEEHRSGAIGLLQQLLGHSEQIRRIESFDISNTSGKDIVASMVVFEDGKKSKKDYKRFQIRDLTDQDDYASMYQVIMRRFKRYVDGEKGFDQTPDMLLIDGGAAHAKIAEDALRELGLTFPVYGMVKDNRHRTRALTTSRGEEIGIIHHPAVFALVGQIQEETHRFAIEYHRSLRRKHLRESVLDEIPGIGAVRKKQLLSKFHSVSGIRGASIDELRTVVPESAAKAVYDFFHQQGDENT